MVSQIQQAREQQRTEQPAAIVVERLTKRYKQAREETLRGISFSVAQGSFFTLLGPNGAGKTTTLSILTTLLLPTSGRVTIAGLDLVREAREVRRQISVIFQQPGLDVHMTGEENLRFHASLFGFYPFRPAYRLMPVRYRKRVMELAALFELERDLFRPVSTYSGGMKRKLEVMRSLLQRPEILFLDEPTAGLDPHSRARLWSYLKRIRSEYGLTIFLTTHYLEEAEQADTICILHKGKIVAFGSPAEIKEALLQEYMLVDAADRERLLAELRVLGLPFSVERRVKLLVRKEQFHRALRSITTPLTVIETYTPSLEEAYLHITDGRE
uniref:ABC transporter ATP-binding protein n=1 Tax=Thermosporothrix sp. COM3 TaxID=2490863 RepID=A0A455SJT3_9CHLR|nr:ABC transporter ATP-binding protein [Thermosporothrix sp. COM3]